MYQNSDREVLKELASDNYKSHSVRNLTAVLAVFLTTLLLTAVLTAGTGFFVTGANAGEQTPGPMSDGYIQGGEEELLKLQKLPEIEWADLVVKASGAPLHNNVFGGVETRLYAPDENFYRHNLIRLKTGQYPQKKDDILISDTMAKRLGLPLRAGLPFTLEVVLQKNGVAVETKLPLHICGIYENPLFSISGIYEEIYTSRAFVDAYNPELPENKNIIYVKLANLNPLLLKSDVRGKLSDAAAAVGAAGFSPGKNSADFSVALISTAPFLLIALLLMASGYFLVFNVFYISFVSDIRWFGMMKTIGATTRQIKSILNRQVWKNAFWGILAGVGTGYLAGLVIAPRLISMTRWSVYYKRPPFLFAALFSILFSCLTVKISVSKPVRTASGISPIEAARYSPKKKKYIFTVTSLTLGSVIFLATVNAVLGYDTIRYVDRYNQEDYRIFHKSSLWSIDESYQPISTGLIRDMAALPFVKSVDTVYMARTENTLSVDGFYEESSGEIAPHGKLWEYMSPAVADSGRIGLINGSSLLSERGNLKIGIFGLPPERWDREKSNYRVTEGEIDTAKFASGQYLIYNEYNLKLRLQYLSAESKAAASSHEIHAGDILDLSFYDDALDTYRPKKLEVMAVIGPAHEYSSSDISSASLILPDSLFKQIYSGHENLVSGVQVRAVEELDKNQVARLDRLVQREHSTQLFISSRFSDFLEAARNKQTYAVIGFFLAGILAVVGVSNVVNTVTSDVFAHRIEYASMQSVGMTKAQLRHLLFVKNMRLCGLSLLLTVPCGAIAGSFMANDSLFTGFSIPLYAVMLLILAAVMLGLCASLSALLVKFLNRKPVAERLREAV